MKSSNTFKKLILIALMMHVSFGFAQKISVVEMQDKVGVDGIYLDTKGIMFIAEGWNGQKISKVFPDGRITTFSTNHKGPIDIVRSTNGYFYISEWQGSGISKVDKNGKLVKFIKTLPGPGPMTIDTKGNIYVTHNVNNGSGYVGRISNEDEVTVFSSDSKLINPGGIAADKRGNLYVVNFNNGNIVKIDLNGKSKILATLPGTSQWKSGYLKVHLDKIYVTGAQENKIYAVDFQGNINSLVDLNKLKHNFKKASESSILIGLKSPIGLAVDIKMNTLYISKGFEKTKTIVKFKLEKSK